MDSELGRRERKKEQTRQLIAEAALRLFRERGFDAVTVAQVARAADVSEATVFNYFPTKESLFYAQMENFEERLIDAVRNRPAGETVLGAVRGVIQEGTGCLAGPGVAEAIAMAAGIIGSSPSLRAREREVVAGYTEALGRLIAEETGARAGDIEPWVVANALMGAHRAVVGAVRSEALAGRRGPSLARHTREQIRRSFGRLERGLEGYGVRD